MEIQIGLLGLGTVGGGVYRLLAERQDSIARTCGVIPRISKVLVRDPQRTRHLEIDDKLLTTDPAEILEDDRIGLVIELIGGTEPAHTYVKKALKHGKHVVLANKELIARYGTSLLSTASARSRHLLFEAAVAGGIPIIRILRESLVGDRILALQGIVNGTTNYILTRMSQDEMPFAQALEEAQRKGYAEADPGYDILGVDAMYKLAILMGLGFHTRVRVADLPYQGIDKVHLQDIRYARDLGYAVKLLAHARDVDGELYGGVAPCLVPTSHPLASVMENFNAIWVHGEWSGDLMFYGQGAGGRPTATAVVSDVIKVMSHLSNGNNDQGRVHYREPEKRLVHRLEELPARHYLRLRVQDQPGVLASIAMIFAREKVSFLSVLQTSHGEPVVDVVFMTHSASGRQMARALEKVTLLPSVDEVAAAYRVI
ncbi:MAG: homoserine dehydrogenase [Candidatus Xenobia bacterium]